MDLQTLQQQCLACRRCSLCETRTHVVFGQGAADAEVLFVGEGPGANEDAQGLPFVGRSGQLCPSNTPKPAYSMAAYSSSGAASL